MNSSMNQPLVRRHDLLLKPNPARVLLRPFQHGDAERIRNIAGRVIALPEEAVLPELESVVTEFSARHHRVHSILLERFEQIRPVLSVPGELTEPRRCLIGAAFMAEYAIEAAALFNPSIVAHPTQDGVEEGSVRVILSLRSVGEGHISSITFRTGVISSAGSVEMEEPTGFLTEPQQAPNSQYERDLFARTLTERQLPDPFVKQVLNRVDAVFTLTDLRGALDAELEAAAQAGGIRAEDQSAAEGIWSVARSNFEVQFEAGQPISECVLFPATPSQRNGIEDARFVRFQDEDGRITYYATFTAYDGRVIMPELVETTDFRRFRFITLNGPAAQNKGMALFPRKIGGKYVMLSRQDNECISIMFSDNVHFWNDHCPLLKPAFPWEAIQIGNCGSPMETDAGWLVLSHGVGPLRKYSIGAFLLDLEDPTRIIGRLSQPLLTPNVNERVGYVPNVVYTCGAMIHQGQLIIPYGMSDSATGFASGRVDDVLSALLSDMH